MNANKAPKNKKLLAIPIIVLLAIFAWKFVRRESFRYAGTVEATDVSLSPRISETISTVTVQEGDVVRQGQVLVELHCEDLKLAADIAERNFLRSEKLYKEGSIPFETYDRDRNRRDDTALKVSWCRIFSPINGTVLARLREPEEWASPGIDLFTLANIDEVYAYIYVPQTVLFRIKPGEEVQAYLPEAGDKPRKGRIAFIRPEAEFTPKNVQTREERTRLVYGVKVMLDNSNGLLKPGMPIEVQLPQ